MWSAYLWDSSQKGAEKEEDVASAAPEPVGATPREPATILGVRNKKRIEELRRPKGGAEGN